MHVLLIPSWYSTTDKPWRGSYVRDQALALQRAGHRVGLTFVERRSLSRLNPFTFGTSHFQTVERIEDDIPTMRMLGWSTFAQTVPGSLVWTALMRRLVSQYVLRYGVPDVIHGHAALWGGYAAMRVAQDVDRPFVVTEHSSTLLTGRIRESRRQRAASVYRRADSVIAVSGALAKKVDELAGVRVARVVPNLVDTALFTPATRDEETRRELLAVCDLVDYKNVDVLLHAFASSAARRNGVTLAIVGTGKETQRLRRTAAELDIDRDVTFTGALPRAHVRVRMRHAAALVLPSDVETFGVVLIEAMSCGLPVIATRCGGPEEIVAPHCGMLVERRDPLSLARAIDAALARTWDGAAIREYAQTRFDYEPVAQQLTEIYARLVRRASAGAPARPVTAAAGDMMVPSRRPAMRGPARAATMSG